MTNEKTNKVQSGNLLLLIIPFVSIGYGYLGLFIFNNKLFGVLKRLLLLIVLLISFLGCRTMGPKSVMRDQFSYNEAIASSSNQQMLLNLIRLRYNESPQFLKVGSVISQYTHSGSLSAGASIKNASIIGGATEWSISPTITYIPFSGQEFSKNLLTPIRPSILFELMQSGWPIELVLSSTVWSINDLDNDIARPSRRRVADPELIEMFQIWRRLREEGIVGIARRNYEKQNQKYVLFLKPNANKEFKTDIDRFISLLNLDVTKTEFNVRYGLIQEHEQDITVLTGSIWEIMLNLSWKFHVPPEHISSGKTIRAFETDWIDYEIPIDIKYSKEKPENAYISLFNQDYWFFIDENDRKSKRMFSFLQLLISLAENTNTEMAPIITVPAK